MNLQRQKSLKAKMNRRACLGSSHEPESEPVIQVTVGSAKYESAYGAVVWKIDRLPDKNSSKYPTPQLLFMGDSINAFTLLLGCKPGREMVICQPRPRFHGEGADGTVSQTAALFPLVPTSTRKVQLFPSF
jgi:hypothetical protein